MPIILPTPKDRILLFNKDVTQITIGELTKSILEIEDDDEYNKKLYSLHNLEYTPPPIKLYIDSHGGDVYHCFGLIGIMKKCKTKINTIVTGCATSAGFIISITGYKRYSYSYSTFMHHQLSDMSDGTLKEQLKNIEEAERLQEIMNNHVLKHTKISKNKLKKVYESNTDWIMSAQDALKLGCIDEIIE